MVSIDRTRPDKDGSVFSPVDTEPSVAVVQGVSAITGDAIEDLPPLREVVDPDALDGIAASPETVTVSFTYAGFEVTVTANGPISIVPAE